MKDVLVQHRSSRVMRSNLTLLGALVLLATSFPAYAQTNSASSITPQTLRPDPDTKRSPEAIPPVERLAPPPGTERLSVRISTIEVEGVLPGVADETHTIIARYENRTLTLSEIYEAASEIEAAHIRKGYILARVIVPPQNLVLGGPVKFVLTHGFIESVDVSAVPSRVRGVVARRTATLVGRQDITIGELERPLVLASAVPGMRMTSTLARGEMPGGARLLLSGHQAWLSGSLSIDNGYTAALGRVGVTAQVSLNSVFGLGEQFYGVAVSGYDLSHLFDSDAPVRVVGGGALFTSGNGRWSINPEATFSHTQPLAEPGIPLTRGALQRFSLRGSHVLARTRTRSVIISAALEQSRETNDAIQFGVRLSDDHFRIGRLQASYSDAFREGGAFGLSGQLSQGLGRVGRPAPGALPSRQGSSPGFTKANFSAWAAKPVSRNLMLTVFGKGQYSFGKPLFRSEQSALEGNDGLSAYLGGETAADSSVTGRAELSRVFLAKAAGARFRLSPYLFAAAGKAWIARPTALESRDFDLVNLGSGVHGSLPQIGIAFSLEYGHGFSHTLRFDKVNRLGMSLSIGF